MMFLSLYLQAPRIIGQGNGIKITFSGDVMFDKSIRRIIKEKGDDYLLRYAKNIFAEYDYNIVNLECPITNKTKAAVKQYTYKADSNSLLILKKAGVTHTGIPNNHSMDYFMAGLEDTYKYLIKYGLVPVGLGKDIKTACRPVLIIKGLDTAALFASTSMYNGTEKGSAAICNCSIYELAELVKKYKDLHPHYMIFVSLHWGVEYTRIPTTEQVHCARMLIDSGAEAVIGHHPHVIQQIEFYKGKLILYSLGNLVFEQFRPVTKYGMFAGFSKTGSGGLSIMLYPIKIVESSPLILSQKEKDNVKKELLQISPTVKITDTRDGWLVEPKSIVLKKKHEK